LDHGDGLPQADRHLPDGPGGLTTTAGDTYSSFDYATIGVLRATSVSTTGRRQPGDRRPRLAYNSEIDDGNSSTADTIDWSRGRAAQVDADGNCTYTFTAPPAMTAVQLRVVQDGTGGRTVTWPGSVLWDKGYAPATSLTAQASRPSSVATTTAPTTDSSTPTRRRGTSSETTTTRTCLATDRGALIDCTHASGCAATIPPHSSVPPDWRHSLPPGGAGQVTLVAGAGVTINTPLTLKTLQQYAIIGVLKIATNTWSAFGLLAYS
jgi:hypothetical protein